MKFSLSLAWKEMKRNSFKVIIAGIVALILFMSAFTLCNIASALPENFYNHYEENFNDALIITISNGDDNLLKNRNNYFVESSLAVENAFDSFKFIKDDKEFLNYNTYEEGGNSYVHFYNAVILDKNDSTFKLKYLEPYLIEGASWETFEEEGIWLADIVAEALNVTIEDKITYSCKVNDEYHDTIVNIEGIFDYDKALSELKSGRKKYPVDLFYLNMNKAEEIYINSHTTYYITGRLNSVRNLFDTYTLLSRNYSLNDSVVVDMVKSVKNAEIICGIIGAILLIGGLVVVMNFISMFISSNRKNIGLMRAMGAKSSKITMAYYIIFAIIILIVCILCWALLPLYNFIVTTYCISVGYNFVIGINYYVVLGLFLIAYIIMTLMMVFENYRLNKLSPTKVLKEED